MCCSDADNAPSPEAAALRRCVPALVVTPAWLAAALWGASWLVPVRELPWLAFHSDLLAASSLAVLALHWQRESSRQVDVPVSALFVLALVPIPLLQAASGLVFFAGDAWLASLYLAGLALAVSCGHAAARTGSGLGRAFALTLLAVALISALMTVRQWLQWPAPHPWWLDVRLGTRPTANVGQPNLLATLMLLGTLAALALHQAGVLGVKVCNGAVALLLAAVALTQSRTAALGLTLVVLGLWAGSRRFELRIGSRMLLGGLGWFALCALARPGLAKALDLTQAQAPLGLSTETRPIHWATVWEAVTLAPWTGYGWNQVAVAQARMTGQAPSGEFIEHSHNLLLDLLVWNGLPLGLGMALAIGAWMWCRVRRCRLPYSALLLAGIGLLLTHAMTEYPLDYFSFLLPLGLAAGAVDALAAPSAVTVSVPRRASAAVVALTAGLLGAVTVDYIAIEADHAAMRAQWDQRDLRLPDAAAVPEVRVLTQMQALLRFMRVDLGPGMSAQDRNEMTRVAERFGYAPVLTRQAIAEFKVGRSEASRAALDRLCRIHPSHVCADSRRRFEAVTGQSGG